MFKIKWKQMIIVAAAIGLLVFLFSFSFLKPINSAFNKVINPFLLIVYRAGSFLNREYIKQTDKTNLSNKIKELETEVQLLTVKNAELNLLAAENKILREHLNFLTANKFNYIMANVISRGDISDISERTETIIIDKGTENGIYVGLPVLTGTGIIIGKVAEAKTNIAKVFLTNNSQCKLAAAVLNQQKTSGITEGELGLTIKMNFIPQTELIKEGDIIVTSGLERSIPLGLVIGKVKEVRKESNDLWQTAILEPLSNFEGITVVSVLIP